MNELKTLEKQVENILAVCTDTRNSDKLLSWKIWEVFYNVRDTINLYDFMKLPSQTSIQRIRAKFQNDLKLFLPTEEEIVKQRRINIDEWKRLMGYTIDNPNQLRLF